jgi:uncharacterized membrane protein
VQAVGIAFLILPGLLLTGLLSLYVTRAAAAGELPRNGLVGIRTRKTQRDDAAWQAGHAAATPLVRAVTVVCFAASGLILVGAAVTQEPAVVGAAALLAAVAIVVLMLRAARVAGHAADATHPQSAATDE